MLTRISWSGKGWLGGVFLLLGCISGGMTAHDYGGIEAPLPMLVLLLVTGIHSIIVGRRLNRHVPHGIFERTQWVFDPRAAPRRRVTVGHTLGGVRLEYVWLYALLIPAIGWLQRHWH